MYFLRTPVCGLLLALCQLQPASARNAPDWNQFWQQAQQHHLEWRQSGRTAALAQAQLEQAQQRPNPELSLSQEGQGAERSRSLQLMLPLETGGKRAARIALAHSVQALQQWDMRQKQQEIQAELRLGFYEALTAQQRLALSQAAQAQAAQAHQLAAQRVAAGKISPQEQSRAALVLAQAELDQAQAAQELALNLGRLAAQAGLPQLTELSGDLDSAPAAPAWEVLQAALPQTPLWRRWQAEAAQAQAASAVERSKAAPDLQLGLGLKQNASPAPGASARQLLFSVAMPLPLFDRNQGQQKEASLRAQAAAEDAPALQQRLQAQLQQAWRRWGHAQQEAQQVTHTLLPESQRILQAAMLGFSHGKFAYQEVQEAQRSHAALQARALQAQIETRRAIAEVERISGPVTP